MKLIAVNASPRKGWNTAKLVEAAAKGAASVGALTEHIDLYDHKLSGCVSCLACKRKGAERCKCYHNDDLAQIISRIVQADAVVIGSPIYFGEPTAHFRALLERLLFCCLSYDGGERSYFEGTKNIGLIYTMNCPEEMYAGMLAPSFAHHQNCFKMIFKGRVETLAAADTLQVKDYSKYAMGMFDPAAKEKSREERFPKDFEKAFELGKSLFA